MPKASLITLIVLLPLAVIIGVIALRQPEPKDTGKDKVTYTDDFTALASPIPTQTPMPTPIPESQIKPGVTYQAEVNTTAGSMVISLNTEKTPITAGNFIKLVKSGFYNNTIFHRVINGFMIQGGDPKGDGTGGPGYKFADEPFEGEYTRGTIAMANAGPNTNGSQFFIMHQDKSLPKNYVIFGKVIKGLETVDKIATASVSASLMGEMSKPVSPVKITSVKIIDNSASVTPSP